MRVTLALCLIAGSAVPAEAEIFPRDASCKHVLTVQYRTCRVKTYFLCGDDGEIVRAEEVRPDKTRKATVYTRDLLPIGVADELGQVVMLPVAGSENGMSLSAVLDGQPTSYSVDIELRMFGMSRSGPYVAEVALLPNAETVDGIEFQRIEEQASWKMPEPIGTITGKQIHYFSVEVGFPLLGEGSASSQGYEKLNEIIPAEIIFPGESGFEDEEPRYDCQKLSNLQRLSKMVPA